MLKEKIPKWRQLPKLHFTRHHRPMNSVSDTNIVYNVQTAQRLGTEFDNRKLALEKLGR